MLVVRIQKWGNSQGLRVSKQVLELAGLDVGDDVEIVVGDHQITAKKVDRPKYDLAELVAQIPPDYRTAEVDFGPPVGREEW